MKVPLQPHCPSGRGLPLRVYVPFIDSVQRLQAQELPVIQAKGLELEHFHLSVSSHWTTVVPPLRLGKGLAGVGGLAFRFALVLPQGPTHMAQPCPAGSCSTRLQYKEQRTQKPSYSSMQLTRQSQAAAVSGDWCFLGLPWGSLGQTKEALAVPSCEGPWPIILGVLASGTPDSSSASSFFQPGPGVPGGFASTWLGSGPLACLAWSG